MHLREIISTRTGKLLCLRKVKVKTHSESVITMRISVAGKYRTERGGQPRGARRRRGYIEINIFHFFFFLYRRQTRQSIELTFFSPQSICRNRNSSGRWVFPVPHNQFTRPETILYLFSYTLSNSRRAHVDGSETIRVDRAQRSTIVIVLT